MKAFIVLLEFSAIVIGSVAVSTLFVVAFQQISRALSSGHAEGGEVRPPEPPADVLVLDGHWWQKIGLEDTSTWAPEHRHWARSVWRCAKCQAESMVYAHDPKIWDVIDRRTGRSIREQGLTELDADLSEHRAVQCSGVVGPKTDTLRRVL